MAIAFDTSIEAVRTDTSDPMTWTHTPIGTPRAIVVALVHGTSSTDHVSTVTYGGVAMSRTVRATDTATEPGAAELWFLGSGIPTGAQTVSADLTSGTTDDIHGVSLSFTANGDTAVVDSDSISENAANPSVTLQYGGRTCMAVAALYGGGADPTAFAENGNCTRVQDHDLGAFYSAVCRQTTAGSSDFAIGGTASSDDVAYVALAVSESLVNTNITPTIGSLTLTGVAGSAVQGLLRTALVGALAATGLAGSLLLGSVAPPPAAALTASGQPVIIGPAVYTQAGTLFLGIDTSTNTSITPTAGMLTATGLAPTVLANTNRTPLVGELLFGDARELTPPSGTLTLTGTVPTQAIAVQPTTGSLALTGLQVTAASGRDTTPSTGALVTGGFAPSMLGSNAIPTSPGTLAWSGVLAAPVVGTRQATSVGSLLFTGNAVAVTSASQPGTGSLTLTTAAPVIGGFNSVRLCQAGSLVFGLDVTGNTDRQPTTGSLALGEPNSPATASLGLTGYAPNLGAVMRPATGALFLGLSADASCQPTTGTLSFTGLQARPNPPDNTDITPLSGILRLFRDPNPTGALMSLTGAAPSVAQSMVVATGGASLALTGYAINSNSPALTPLVGSLTLTGHQPTTAISGSANTSVLPATGSLTLTAPAGLLGNGLIPTTGTLTLTGAAGDGGGGIAPATGTLAFSGAVPPIQVGLVPSRGSLTLQGVEVAFQGRINPPTGSLVLEGTPLSTGTHPTIATSVAGEGCSDALVAAAAREGCAAAVSSPAVEGETATTFTVCDYV